MGILPLDEHDPPDSARRRGLDRPGRDLLHYGSRPLSELPGPVARPGFRFTVSGSPPRDLPLGEGTFHQPRARTPGAGCAARIRAPEPLTGTRLAVMRSSSWKSDTMARSTPRPAVRRRPEGTCRSPRQRG